MKKVFVCAGPQRSGSTWLFNAMRLICEREWADCYGRDSSRYVAGDPCPAHVVKIHDFDKAFAAYPVIITERDWRDMAASAIRFGMTSEQDVLAWVKRQKENQAQWKRLAKLVVPYAAIMQSPIYTVEHVASAMGVTLCGAEIADELKQIPLRRRAENKLAEEWDLANTLMHERHVTDGGIGTWGRTISEELAGAIASLS